MFLWECLEMKQQEKGAAQVWEGGHLVALICLPVVLESSWKLMWGGERVR